MNDLRKAAQQALEFADDIVRGKYKGNVEEIRDALRAALAQPEPDIEQAVAAEREACAKMLDVKVYGDEYATALLNSYADDIRARGEVDYE